MPVSVAGAMAGAGAVVGAAGTGAGAGATVGTGTAGRVEPGAGAAVPGALDPPGTVLPNVDRSPYVNVSMIPSAIARSSPAGSWRKTSIPEPSAAIPTKPMMFELPHV